MNAVRIALFVALAVVAAACGSEVPASQPETVSLAADLPAACADAVARGVEFWNEHGVPLRIVSSGRGDVHVIGADLPGSTAGRTRIGGGMRTQIEIEECDGEVGTQTAAHELGHAIGLKEHHPDPSNLMHASTTSGANVALDDEQSARIGAL